MKKRIFVGLVIVIGAVMGIYAWNQRRTLRRDFAHLEHEFRHMERRVKGRGLKVRR